MSKRLIIGNWKMNPATLDEAKEIARGTRAAAAKLSHVDVVVCPPFPFLSVVTGKGDMPHFALGAQSASIEEENGSYTGEVSATMLADMGVEHVIVGHSEERARGDDDITVARRVRAVLDAGMKAVLCVGEKERDEGGAYLHTLKEQIVGSLTGIPTSKAKNIILAYEPVWAIGAQDPLASEQIREMGIFVRKTFSDVFSADQALKATLLYGGSVNARNAADIVSIGQVDGLLVGRESLHLTAFVELLKAVDGVR